MCPFCGHWEIRLQAQTDFIWQSILSTWKFTASSVVNAFWWRWTLCPLLYVHSYASTPGSLVLSFLIWLAPFPWCTVIWIKWLGLYSQTSISHQIGWPRKRYDFRQGDFLQLRYILKKLTNRGCMLTTHPEAWQQVLLWRGCGQYVYLPQI